MKLRMFSTWIPLTLALVAVCGCDTGTPVGDTVDTAPDENQADRLAPALIDIEGTNDQPVQTGDVITLVGINFSQILNNNEVLFSSGTSLVRGLPLNVRNEPFDDGSPNNNSRLEVVVPGGVSSGQVSLSVDGRPPSARTVDAIPQIIGFTLGINQDESYLIYTPRLGFEDGGSRVTVYGTSFAGVQEAVVSDESGNQRVVPSNTFIRDSGTQVQQGQRASGLSSISFNLRDDSNDVRLPFSGNRGNLGVILRGVRGDSNRIEIPVTTDPAPEPDTEEIGFVISSVKAPTGVVTGPVRLEYVCYELAADAEWDVDVFARVSNDAYTSEYFQAKPMEAFSIDDALEPFDDEDFEEDDFYDVATRAKLALMQQIPFTGPSIPNNWVSNVIAGTPRHRVPGRLFPGIGALRTFIWDAPNDPIFRQINEQTGDTGLARPRYWRVEFRIIPTPSTANRGDINHEVLTPAFLYYHLNDRPDENFIERRSAVLVEDFTTDNLENVDTSVRSQLSVPGTTLDQDDVDRISAIPAVWGPPVNPGFLSGDTSNIDVNQFGVGEAIMVLRPVSEDFLEPGELVIDEWVEFDTDRMEIIHHVISDNATPGQIDDDVDATFLEVLRGETCTEVENPGELDREFHFARFAICDNLRVESLGAWPLVVRLSGLGTWPSDLHPNHCLRPAEVANPCALTLPNGEPLPDSTVFYNREGANLDFSGSAGGAGSPEGSCPCPCNCGLQNGGGGRGGAGAGNGGAGGQLDIYCNTTRVRSMAEAGDGGNNGGRAGGTPGAAHFDPVSNQGRSFYHGAPGGGGGHRELGETGDYGRKGIAQYPTPRLGFGGPPRGSAAQFPLTAGSGGGGGGASLTFADSTFFSAAGGGGGGGGGAFRVIADGDARVDGLIAANGGAGGDGVIPHIHVPFCPDYPHTPQGPSGAPGGGGSGGSIVLQASGRLAVASCDLLSVEGGEGGAARSAGNSIGGEGSPGYIRLESGVGGLPFCGDATFAQDDLDLEEPEVTDIVAVDETLPQGRGQDGVIHINFIQSFNPQTGQVIVDASGSPQSIWRYNTDTGRFQRPDGTVSQTRVAGLIDVTRLIIDEDTTLRVSGARPLQIFVREFLDLYGTIDVSGFDGGILQFTSPGVFPGPGPGGAAGPGGGAGGRGGFVNYIDGNPTNNEPGNTIPIDGSLGGVPPGTEGLFVEGGIAPDELLPFEFLEPTGGVSLPGRVPCEAACREGNTAAGGGGGGNFAAGANGAVLLSAADPDLEAELIGTGGTAFGFDDVRYQGDLFLAGGTGGAGGGGNPYVSSAYERGLIEGRFAFPAAARTAPGTGGGGGGGVLHMIVGTLNFRSTGRILARGGNAFQSIDLGGNGGGGAGGTVLIQVRQDLNFESGGLIDVRGGVANVAPPVTVQGGGTGSGSQTLTAYEGNFRPNEGGTRVATGGLGGSGAAGRVRIETPIDSGVAAPGSNVYVTTGTFLTNVIESIAVSEPVQLGLGPGFAASSFRVSLGPPRVLYSPLQPPGTSAVVLWQGGRSSTDILGEVGPMTQLVPDPRLLEHQEYLRFVVFFRSSLLTRNSQTIRSIELPYTVEPLIESDG